MTRPNQVWAADPTYIPMAQGNLYLVAVMDWASRRVLSWRLSNSLDASGCVSALREALARHGRPEIFHTEIKAAGSPARPSPDCSKRTGCESAWTVGVAARQRVRGTPLAFPEVRGGVFEGL